jgi:hypothetical protein
MRRPPYYARKGGAAEPRCYAGRKRENWMRKRYAIVAANCEQGGED